MKYYAMSGDRRIGPFTLEELPENGVRPDTYVWTKGMPDWKRASEVADICRYFRLRLSNSLPEAARPGNGPAATSYGDFAAMGLKDDFSADESPRSPRQLKSLPDEQKYPSYLPWLLYAVALVMMLVGFLIL